MSSATAFPPAWRLLWRLGFEVAPPPFLGFGSLALITGSAFGLLFALGIWVLSALGLRDLAGGAILGATLVAGPLFGLFMAAYYRRWARDYGLGPWAAYGVEDERT